MQDYYREYKNTICAVNEQNFDVLCFIYEYGPVSEKELGMKRDVIEPLINAQWIRRSCGMLFISRFGCRLLEGLMNVIDYPNN